MIPAQISVEVNEEEIKEYIQQKINQQLTDQLHFVDINRLVYMTSLSKRYLEDEFLHKPSVKLLERRKNERGKRIWLYPQVLEAIKSIMDSDW
ncbi:hypothetical protein [Paraliobacillus zengyii]|uniref:hypothetical protein n=1 Tax=Paraliobacillus zengyii TaxID=2213194 RepID=UPI000DD42FD0|nr:hypothetical protein [Paraliobacillus zengyii]